MTHEDFNDLETRDYIFKIGDKGKGIQARYDKNTDALIFPRAAFDYVCDLLKEALLQESVLEQIRNEIRDSCYENFPKDYILQIIDKHTKGEQE